MPTIEKRLQNIIFPRQSVCGEKALYFRGDADMSGGAATLACGGILSLDTYFNSFSLGRWMEYTKLENLNIALDIEGEFAVTVSRAWIDGGGVNTEQCSNFTARADKRAHIRHEIPFVAVDGSVYISLTAVSESAALYGGYFYTEADPAGLARVKLGLNICTYRREEYIKRNLRMISARFFSGEPGADDLCEIFISDNGNTLEPADFPDPRIRLVQNKNAGGSGGFTRGIIEILKANEIRGAGVTHVVFMDDDITVDPEVIFRTHAVLTLLKPEFSSTFVGGTMLRADRPYEIHESGAHWGGGDRYVPLKIDTDARIFKNCLLNEYPAPGEPRPNYHAWWYCAVPVTVTTAENLPLPLFIKADDVEYGVRNMKNLIILNGIGVWHEPFDNTKYSPTQWYYILRNQLIAGSTNNFIDKKSLIKCLRLNVLREIFWYRYKNAGLILRGALDYLKGPHWLLSSDSEALHGDITAAAYRMQPVADLGIPFDETAHAASVRPKGFRRDSRLKLLTINGLFFPAKRKQTTADLYSPLFAAFYRAKRVLNCDKATMRGFITEKRIFKSLGLLFKLLLTELKLRIKFNKTIKKYMKDKKALTGIAFWERNLGIEGKEKTD